jgi:hypothetical protein
MTRKAMDYKGLAVSTFRRTIGEAFPLIWERSLKEDWQQEIELAAWEAGRQRLALKPAVQLCARHCYRFLVEAGFVRPRVTVNGKRVWRSWRPANHHYLRWLVCSRYYRPMNDGAKTRLLPAH